ncbi:MAG: phage tail tape measure protein [Bacteroidales bacterium]|jgi:TP901 family phage tail tape measure protein|nr:phage tail tape measure protein [Bacteroidales bacterium]
MATGSAKLRLLLELKNKLGGGLNSAKHQVEKACGGLQNKLSRFSAANGKMFDAIKTQIPGVGSALGMISNPYVAVAAAAVAAGAAIVKCTQAAMDWEKSIADVQVTAQLSKKELGKLSDYLKTMGTEVAVELEDIPKAFGMILGAINDVDKSKDLLKPTLFAAKGLGASLESTAAAMSAVAASTGYAGDRIGDILAATNIEGAVGFEDVAQFFPKILPGANALGLKLEEITGAYAALSGLLGARYSATDLDALINELQSGEKIKKLEGIGINVFDKKGSVRSLVEIIQDFKKKFDPLTDKQRALKFSELKISDTASKALLTLMQNYDDLKEKINETTNSQGALQQAYEDNLTTADKWKLVQNNLKVAMIEIGELFLPILTAIGQKVLDVINWVKKLWNENQILKDGVALLGKIIKVTFLFAIAQIMRVFNCFKLLFNIVVKIISKIGEFIVKIFGIKSSFSEVYNKIRPYLLWIYELFAQIGDLAYKIFTFDFFGAWDSIKNFKIPSIDDIKARIVTETQTEEPTNDGTTKDITTKNKDNKTNEDITKIANGSKTKTINITIGNVVENWQTLNSDFKNMGKAEVETYLTTIIIRTLQSLMMAK